MATTELPLAEVEAVFVKMHRGHGGLCNFTMRVMPEHIPTLNAYIDGPSGDKVVLVKLCPVPPDYKPADVDPNQGEDVEDITHRLHKTWDALIERMTNDAQVQP